MDIERNYSTPINMMMIEIHGQALTIGGGVSMIAGRARFFSSSCMA
jgi:hypothetical protein